MATNTAATQARQYTYQTVHYARKRVLGSAGNATYNDRHAALRCEHPSHQHDGKHGDVGRHSDRQLWHVGFPAAFFAAAGAPVTTAGRNAVTLIATGTLNMSADTVIVGVIAGTPTAGTVDFEIEYTVNNDN
jgi:hypothetical protein